jgi:SEC-C motif
MSKTGKNAPCPCGSGKKFKKCCLNKPLTEELESPEISLILQRLQAKQKQIEKQQGLGRGIISGCHQGLRFVAVGETLFYSKKWKTFHDFLYEYLKTILGKEWWEAEIKKQPDEQHPIIQWVKLMASVLKSNEDNKENIKSTTMTGAVYAYMNLSYNLYLLAHNIKVQEHLIKRLKHKEQFLGALYETYIIACFIKAGFKIELENESDGSTTHCEFTAISPNKNKYSIEAKIRTPHKGDYSIGNQLYEALKKEANNKRIVFIDVNIPSLQQRTIDIESELKNKEDSLKINSVPAPSAYIFITNHSFSYDLNGCNYENVAFVYGFKINYFKSNLVFANLSEALKAREQHRDIINIIKSIEQYNDIPVTFDGEIPEFAYNAELQNNRLLIGNKYIIPTDSGSTEAVLVNAIVSEAEKKIIGVYRPAKGGDIISSSPMTEKEYIAYKHHPDTFFGVVLKQSRKANDALDLYDFFHESYKSCSREQLLGFLKAMPDYEILKDLSDEELLFKCCEGWVYSAMNK